MDTVSLRKDGNHRPSESECASEGEAELGNGAAGSGGGGPVARASRGCCRAIWAVVRCRAGWVRAC